MSERRMARRFIHRQNPWRSCTSYFGGFCARCLWRRVTGQQQRELAAHIARAKAMASKLEPIRYRYNPETCRYERVDA